MMIRIFFIISVSTLLFSCPKDDDIMVSMTEPPEELEPIENENLIDSFLWAVPVDSSTIRNRDQYIVRHALIHENLVMFHTPELEGWVALDGKTGETVWDNRGQLNKAEIFDSPIQYGEFMYYMRTSSFLKINMTNGNLELKELWPVADEFQYNCLGIDRDKVYSIIDEFNNIGPAFEAWLSIPIDEIVSPPLEWKRFNSYFSSENNEVKQGSGTPVFYSDINGHRNMIYASNNRTSNLINTVNNTVTSYDLDADSIKWIKEVSDFGAFGTGTIIDEDRVYNIVDSSMVCISAETGETLWKADPRFFNETFAFGAGMHVVGDKIVAIGTNSKNVGLNKYTGEAVWFVNYDANHLDRDAGGSRQFAVDIYQGRIYYISGSGQLVSLNPDTGSVRRYYLPDRPIIEEYDIQLFEPSFRLNGMTISDDGIVYLSEGLRFLALEVPDKDM